MWPVFVLLWNHALKRKRKWFLNIFNVILLPILYFLLIYHLSNLTITNEKQSHTYSEPLALKSGVLYPMRVLYGPETRFTNELMDRVGAKLNLSRLDHMPGKNERGYFPFSNVQSLSTLEFSKSMSPTDAIVIFEGMESEDLPMTLKYTIRMKNNGKIQKYNFIPSNNARLFPHLYMEPLSMPFLELLWAIDTNYISMRSDTDSKLTLMLHMVPGDSPDSSKAATGCALAMFFLPIMLTSLFTYVTDNLFEGKNSGIHELIKMVGVSWEALCVSHLLDIVPDFLVITFGGTIFFKVTEIVRKTSWGIVLVVMTLHCLVVVSLAFVTVYAVKMTDHLTLLSTGIYFLFFAASVVALIKVYKPMNDDISGWLCAFLLPHYAIEVSWISLSAKESMGGEITVTSMWNTDGNKVGFLFLCSLLQAIMFFLIAGYLARVRPGKFGQALPWNFPCSRVYWGKIPVPATTTAQAQTVTEDQLNQRYFEKDPVGLPAGIKVIDIHKSFGKEAVLHGVNLTVYKGEITILLGHNGAGKTTLISIITGLISATSGQVLVNGKDTVTQAAEVRKTIGLCPQQNIFFPHLTVLQHVMFFAMLKGETYADSKASAKALLVKLQLEQAANLQTDQLSGGMKRRAQFACAVAGGATVLVLDEPTSGLDVETRRELWNLLQHLRVGRTVLLTTHFMEEADALGDRIAALHHGVLRCHATAMFLKRAIGTGYRVSCTTVGAPNEKAITAVITSIVPDATLRDQKPNSVTYNLPANDTSKFPMLFSTLEDRRTELGIDIIGVGKSTLDDVFVQLCSDEKPTLIDESDVSVVEPVHKKQTGVKLCARQLAILLRRQWHYITSGIFSLIFISCFLILLLWLITTITNDINRDTESQPETLSLDLYSEQPGRRALVNIEDPFAVMSLRKSNPKVEINPISDLDQTVFRSVKENVSDYKKYLLGIELKDSIRSAKVLFKTQMHHAAPVAMNLLSNAIAARLLGGDGRTITTRLHQLDSDDGQGRRALTGKMPKEKQMAEIWSRYVVMLTLMFMCKFATLPCAERESGSRLALVLAGCPRALLWASTFIAQLAQTLLLCALPAVVCAAAADKDDTFNRPGFLKAMFTILLVGFIAFLGFIYFITSIAKVKTATVTLFLVIFICTMVTASVKPNYDTNNVLELAFSTLAIIADHTMSPHTLAHGLQDASNVARANAVCEMNREKCPKLFAPDPFDDHVCCDSPNDPEPYSYWADYKDSGAGRCMVTLAFQVVIYFTLTFLSDNGLFSWLFMRLGRRPTPPPPRLEDPTARVEAAYVSEAVKLSKNKMTDVVLCHNVQKSYVGCIKRKPFFAVKNISFSVKKGECFGLLGVNGAGKSTTFKMLTGDTWPTRGEIFSDGEQLSLCNKNKYMRTLSYCPQFFGVDDFLTGRQNLVLLLTLRGLHANDVKAISDSWLKEVGLEQYADKRVWSYSGGCARRLAAAAALCQRARTVLLDEPTAGVDPVARRGMHQALLRARRYGALVIASHSLDEIEALCHRITIMSDGELRALGSAAALKSQYGAGYTIVFKLNYLPNVAAGPTLEDFKSEVQRRLNCTLSEEHQTMLTYRIRQKLRYSELFETVEDLKQKHSLIEDYTLSETTLEEVFLAFAKEARDDV